MYEIIFLKVAGRVRDEARKFVPVICHSDFAGKITYPAHTAGTGVF